MKFFDVNSLQNFAQQTSEAICSVINMQVTIVDSDIKRVAGTGCFSSNVNEVLPNNYVFTRVISTGEICLIENPGQTSYCEKCLERETCKEKATLLVPIILDDKVIGGIGLAAMTDDDKNRLLSNSDNFTTFMIKMADLIAAKVKSELAVMDALLLSKNLEAVTDTFTDGIISINNNDIITHFNRPAELILQLEAKNVLNKNYKNILSCQLFDDALKRPMNVENVKTIFSVNDIQMHMLVSIRTILHDNIIQGIVVFFQELSHTKKKYESVIMSNTRYTFDSIVGKSNEIRQCIDMAKRISVSNSYVLILGESGTGKELFARAIHNSSPRRNNNFIAINCSAIPDSLLESELFGYVSGSFTGAKKQGHIGKFEAANGGTILLDEIGDMPMNLQAKILRVLQDRTVERIGSTVSIPIDVRVIAATNKNLEELIRHNLFRQDLYYRINVIPINIPPLRERKGDILIVSQHLLKKYSLLLSKNVIGFTEDTMHILLNYDWPGNVRELENVIEYAMNMELGKNITIESLPPYLVNSKPVLDLHSSDNHENYSLKKWSTESEKIKIINALSQFDNTTDGKRKCAKYLNISLSTLYRKIKEFNIE